MGKRILRRPTTAGHAALESLDSPIHFVSLCNQKGNDMFCGHNFRLQPSRVCECAFQLGLSLSPWVNSGNIALGVGSDPRDPGRQEGTNKGVSF